MAVVVVGGHTRNIGKTSVVAGLIAAMTDLNWTAIKITQFGHGMCSADGKPCGCETADHSVAVSEEHRPSHTDTGRYLAAGAARSLWVRTRQGHLIEAMARIRKEIEGSANTLIESNSVLRFLKPDLYLSVLDPAVMDFKASAFRYLDRADAILIPVGAPINGAVWPTVSQSLYVGVPQITMQEGAYVTPELVHFVENRLILSSSRHVRTSEMTV